MMWAFTFTTPPSPREQLADAESITDKFNCELSLAALPLASDAVAFILLVVVEHTQFCVAGIGINFFSGMPRKGSRTSIRLQLERPNFVFSRNADLIAFAQTSPRAKNNLREVRPNVVPRFLFSGVFGVRALFSFGGFVFVF